MRRPFNLRVSYNGVPQAAATSVASNTVGSAQLVDGSVVAVDIADQAVTLAKVSRTGGNSGEVLTHQGAGSAPAWAAPAAASIADGSITLAKLADLATDRLIGRQTAGTGVPEAVTCTAAGRALLDDADAAAQRATLAPSTAYTGASTGWTSDAGVGTATTGSAYGLEIATGITTAPEVYPTADHPRHHRDVSAQLAGEADWSITWRVGATVATADSRLLTAIGAADDSRGVQVLVAPDGTVELGSWIATSYTAAAVAAGSIPIDGTGWCRLICRSGVITAQWGTGTSTDPPTSWTQVGGSVVLVAFVAARLSLYVAMWTGTGIATSIDDVRVRPGA